MQLQVLSHAEVPIACEDDVVLARRKVKSVAQGLGFDAFAQAAVTTAASEIARNVWVHARGGRAIIEAVSDGVRSAVRMKFVDDGPGITEIERVLQGGFSTARSLGLGVSGSRRLVDEFAIESTPGKGTAVTMLKWSRF